MTFTLTLVILWSLPFMGLLTNPLSLGINPHLQMVLYFGIYHFLGLLISFTFK